MFPIMTLDQKKAVLALLLPRKLRGSDRNTKQKSPIAKRLHQFSYWGNDEVSDGSFRCAPVYSGFAEGDS
jgi:hypothetical protein